LVFAWGCLQLAYCTYHAPPAGQIVDDDISWSRHFDMILSELLKTGKDWLVQGLMNFPVIDDIILMCAAILYTMLYRSIPSSFVSKLSESV
jgi:hypothetical protein